MNIEKMRDEFETAVALEEGEPVLAVYLSRRNETYSTSTLHFAWWAWRQSREALVIDVPDLQLCCEDFGVEFIKSIEAVGVKVKS